MYIPHKFALTEDETKAALSEVDFAVLVSHDEAGYAGHAAAAALRRALADRPRRTGQPALARNRDRVGGHLHRSAGLHLTQLLRHQSRNRQGRADWNYDVLNVYGQLVAHDDPEWVLNLVTALTNRHESGRAAPWQVTDAPETYTRAQLKAIVGIELVISKVEGKAKMSQNQPERNRAGVVAGLNESGAPADQVVADRVDSLGNTNANGRG